MNPATLPDMRDWIMRPRLSARFYERLGLPVPPNARPILRTSETHIQEKQP